VYPGATHTRLEHSLGVVHQVQSLVVAMNTRHATKGGRYISEGEGKLLRLAGLLHDVGHGLMSHVSENALASERLCEDISLAFGKKLDIESASLSEIAAYYMLGSAACKSLLGKAIELTGDSDLSKDDLSKVQRTIIGLSISDNVPLLHELISGPFDADKLDYMPRDASMCGVPVVTDIPRLIQKVRAVEVAQQELPPEVAKNATQGLPSYIMTGVALSGGRTLDELMLWRTLLFD
jgi:HD superfamily phosphohydrolase